jgi:2-(1,2-epoxy-1,2-dihydrophenyl)acetyl-CoA isomerase
MALSADSIDAATAERWGLVWQVVPQEQLTAAAEAMAQRLAGAPRAALRGIKRRLRDAATETLDEALTAESILQGQLGRTPDYQEAVSAFLSKRTPRFD